MYAEARLGLSPAYVGWSGIRTTKPIYSHSASLLKRKSRYPLDLNLGTIVSSFGEILRYNSE